MSDHKLKGKVSLVTAASRTLGAEIAREMARQGAHIVVNYHQSKEEAAHLCHSIQGMGVDAFPVKADVTQESQVKKLVAAAISRFGRIDILVNNYGPYIDIPFLELETTDFDAVLAGNVRAVFLMAREVAPILKAQRDGQVINIAASDYVHRSHSIYGLAKNALVYLTEALALELAPEVRVNAVAPDLIAENEDMSPELVEGATAATPLGRLVTRREVAEVVAALCASPFNSVTGCTIGMDGGRSISRINIGPIQSGRHP